MRRVTGAMSFQSTDNSDYCSRMVRARDEDRWLAAGYAPAPLQRALMALYAFQIELRRIPGAVSEAPLGEIRLQWWRDAFAEIREGRPVRAHPVVQEIAASGLADENLASLFNAAIDAAARPLYAQGFADLADLEGWLRQSDGSFEAMAVRLAGGDEELASLAQRGGAGFALAREGSGLAPALGDDARMRAVEIVRETRAGFRSAPAAVGPALLHLALTKSYASRGARAFPIVKRLCLFAAMGFGRY